MRTRQLPATIIPANDGHGVLHYCLGEDGPEGDWSEVEPVIAWAVTHWQDVDGDRCGGFLVPITADQCWSSEDNPPMVKPGGAVCIQEDQDFTSVPEFMAHKRAEVARKAEAAACSSSQ